MPTAESDFRDAIRLCRFYFVTRFLLATFSSALVFVVDDMKWSKGGRQDLEGLRII